MITILSHFTTLLVLEPIAIDKTLTRTWTFTNRDKMDSDKAIEDAKRDSEFVNSTGFKEDQVVVESIQRGIRSGANEYYIFGKYEKLIGHFHRGLHQLLDDVGAT